MVDGRSRIGLCLCPGPLSLGVPHNVAAPGRCLPTARGRIQDDQILHEAHESLAGAGSVGRVATVDIDRLPAYDGRLTGKQ